MTTRGLRVEVDREGEPVLLRADGSLVETCRLARGLQVLPSGSPSP